MSPPRTLAAAATLDPATVLAARGFGAIPHPVMPTVYGIALERTAGPAFRRIPEYPRGDLNHLTPGTGRRGSGELQSQAAESGSSAVPGSPRSTQLDAIGAPQWFP
jgi:hypothetical protein